MQTRWPPTQDSIFGYTQGGVPNPNVPHKHPYPTRYHGPIFTVPGVAKLPYAVRPYLNQPLPTGTAGFGGAVTDPVTGESFLDAFVGAGMGAAFAPDKNSRVAWAMLGGVSGYLFGGLGLVGVFGLGVYQIAGGAQKGRTG